MAIVNPPPPPAADGPVPGLVAYRPPPPLKTYDDIKREGNINYLFWGKSKAGKTSLAGTFPGLLYIDTDHEGIKVWKNPEYINRFGKPDLIGWSSFDDDYDKYGLFTKATAVWDVLDFINTHAERPDVKTVVLDSLTTFQELCMHIGLEVSATLSDKGKSRSQTLHTARTKTHVALPTQADFGSEMNVLVQIMNQLVAFDRNIICIAHERDEVRENVLTAIEPYLIGSSVRGMIAKWFDEIWYIESNMDGTRTLVTKPRGLIKTVDSRALGLKSGMVDPDYKKIMKEVGMAA